MECGDSAVPSPIDYLLNAWKLGSALKTSPITTSDEPISQLFLLNHQDIAKE